MPINLTTSLYKLIFKAFVSRLTKELPTTIEETQSVYRRRQILDCCLLANEVVENLSGKKNKEWVFKVDFEKAYDNVEWGFLDYVLLEKKVWRDMVKMDLGLYFQFLLMVDLEVNLWVRELKQGDPSSPFLFNFIVDVLGRLID